MAPDFETPRLVRRLDWFQDDSLVASYQQVRCFTYEKYRDPNSDENVKKIYKKINV